MSAIGPHSSRIRLRSIDGRTAAGRYVRAIQRELIAECGGEHRVSTAARLLAERVSVDLLRLKLMDQALASGACSDHLGRIAHALRNTVRLSLRDLAGLAAKPKPAHSLDELVADVLRRKRRTAKAERRAVA